MIITCPKCRAKFDIPNNAFLGNEQKFQCAECGTVWVQTRQSELVPPLKEDIAPPLALTDGLGDPRKLMKGMGLDEPVRIYANANVLLYIIAGFAALIIVIIAVFFRQGDAPLEKPVEEVAKPAAEKPLYKNKKLHIEISSLTPIKQGGGDFVVVSGFILNKSSEQLLVPKLLIKIENKQGRLLQEQEREVEAKILGPQETVMFEYKIHKFSPEIYRFIVDFAGGEE